MKRRSVFGLMFPLALHAGIAHSETAQASESAYLGAKFGVFNLDFPEATNPIPLGFQIGYHFNGGLSLELEYLSGDGDVEVSGTDVDVDVTTVGLYGTYRSEDPFYWLVKMGVLREEVEASVGRIALDADDTGLSLGGGAGYRFSQRVSVEAEYTIIEADVDYIGATLRFSL